MKRLLIMLTLLISGLCATFAQTDIEKLKKDASKSKEVKKDVAEKIKEGWKTVPGASSLQDQFEFAYVKNLAEDSDGEKLFLCSEGMVTAEDYDAAKMNAMTAATERIVQQLESEVKGIIKGKLATFGAGQKHASLEEYVSATKSELQATISIQTSAECYKVESDKRYTVLVRAYKSRKRAKEEAEIAIENVMRQKALELEKEVDEMR